MTVTEEIREALMVGRHEEAWALYQLYCCTSDQVSAEMHHLGGRAAILNGNLHGALRVFEAALRAGASGETLGRVRLLYGEALRRTGNLVDAEEMLRGFLAGLETEYPQLGPMWRAGAYINLGLTCRQRRCLSEARRCYMEAAEECRREGLRQYLGYALRNLAWVCCLQGDAAAGGTALDEAEHYCDDPGDRWHQRLGRAFEAAVRGDRRVALDQCRQIVAAGGESNGPPTDVVAHAAWLAGRVAMAAGDLARAEELANLAIDWGDRCQGERRAWLDGAELLQEVRRRQRDGSNQVAGA